MGVTLERGVDRRSERWILQPLERPRLLRYCPGCGLTRQFVCSGKFRVNAQKKALDVWLNYRCAECEGAWKAPIHERCPVSQMDPALLAGFEGDDPAIVDRYAFDPSRWRAHVIGVVAPSAKVERSAIACVCSDGASLCVHLEVGFDCDLRLDRLLASELGVPRSRLEASLEAGTLSIAPEQRGALRKRVRDGQRVRIRMQQE